MRSFIHINGIKYDAPKIMEEIMDHPPAWKLKGLEFLIQLLDPSDSPVQFHTSGTTGKPRDIFFSKKQILHSAENTCRYFGIDSNSSLWLCLPADFVAGRLMIARAFVSGADLIWTEPSLHPSQGDHTIDFAAFTPAQVTAILNDQFTKYKLKGIKKIIIGGGEISHVLEERLRKLDAGVYATYGMTETLTHVAVRKMGEKVYHSVYPDVKFSVNNDQCLVIDLPFVGSRDLVTTDMVELIDDQSFIWKGRRDHVINSGGLKLHPEEMEAKIIAAGVLAEGTFYISSKPDPQFGHVPVLVLLKQTYDQKNADNHLTEVNSLLNKHEVVKAVIILDKFEYTENGKLKRQKFT